MRYLVAAIMLVPLAVQSTHVSAEIILSGTGYIQNFDGLGSGLPTGVTVRTGATSSSLGTLEAFSNSAINWGNNSGAFKNFASATGLSASSNSAAQSSSADRALGIRQTNNFGDPGAAFTFQFDNTTGFQDFSLSFQSELLSEENRSTTWDVQWATGASPASFNTLGSFTQNAWGEVARNYVLPGAVNDQSVNLWIRVVALNASTGSNQRDSFGIDDFSLSFTPIPEPTSLLLFGSLASFFAARRRRLR